MCHSTPPPTPFSAAEQQYLHQLSQKLLLSVLLSSVHRQEAIGMDFVYHSVRLAGNRYDRHDVAALLKDGRTAAKPLFADAVMLLNLWRGYQYLLSCFDDKHTSIQDFIINSHALIMGQRLPQPQTALNGLLAAAERLPNPFDRALYWHDALAFGAYLPNGRHLTARQTAAFVLMRAGVFPCVVWEGGGNGGQAADGGGKEGFMRAYGQTVRCYGVRVGTDRGERDKAA